MIQDMTLELPHRLRPVADDGPRAIRRNFLILCLATGLLVAATLWRAHRDTARGPASIGWASEITLAKGRSSDGWQGRDGQAEQAASGRPEAAAPSLDVTLVTAMPRRTLAAALTEAPDLPRAPDALLAPPLPLSEVRVRTPPHPSAPDQPQATAAASAAQASDAAPEGAGGQGARADLGAPRPGGAGQRDARAGSARGGDETGAGAGRSDGGVTGRRVAGADIAAVVTGWTLVGSEGAFDGSEPVAGDDPGSRSHIPWRVYYDPDGTLIARWTMLYARVPHGPLDLVTFTERGTWTIQGDELCQSIKRWGYGLPNCFEMRKVERDGRSAVALYYTQCGGLTRCYPGRLGPEGEIAQGKVGFD